MLKDGTGAPLIERERELAAIDRALVSASAREGRAILVEGAAGIGKTRILEAAAAAGERERALVLRARGVEVERDAAFGVLRQLLERELIAAGDDELAEWTEGAAALSLPIFSAEALHGAEPVDVEPTIGLLHGIYWLVANLAERRPLVLVVDDAHWADAPSLRAIAYLSRRLDGVPVAIVIGARDQTDDAGAAALAELERDPAIEHLHLGPLSKSGTGRLVSELGEADAGEAAISACHDSSGGNPFLVTELVFALQQAGTALTEAGVGELTRSGADSLSHAVMLRLGGLGADAIAVAGAVAVLDSDSRVDLVGALAGLSESATADAADRLARVRILADGVPLSFAHPLLRAAVYGDLSHPQRAFLHGRAAAMLRETRAPDARVATHLLATEPGGDDETARLLFEIGSDALAKASPAIAVPHLRRALSEPPPRDMLGDLLSLLGRAETAIGDLAEAERHLRAALEVLEDPQSRVDAALDLTAVLVVSEGHAAAIEALEQVRAGLSGEHALELEARQTLLGVFVPGEVAAQSGERMKEYAHLAGETRTERIALANAALAIAFDAERTAEEALEVGKRALGDGILLSEYSHEVPHYGAAAYAIVLAEDLEASDRETELGLQTARKSGSTYMFASSTLRMSQVALLRGELRDAISHIDTIFEVTRDFEQTPMVLRFFVNGPAAMKVMALAHMGEFEQAREIAADFAPASQLQTAESGMLLYGRGMLEFAEGDMERALEDLLAYGNISLMVGYEERHFPWRLWAAQAELALGRENEAIDRAEEAVEIARVWGAPGGLGTALRVRALVGNPASAPHRLAEAVETLRRSEFRLELARALVDYGVALRRDGERSEARDALEEGVDLATRCEARPLVERGAEELRVLGARPRRLMFSGVESLTASERRIAAMAASGSTNREIAQALFVTQKTVENHLSNVYRKLDINSRRDLPEELVSAT